MDSYFKVCWNNGVGNCEECFEYGDDALDSYRELVLDGMKPKLYQVNLLYGSSRPKEVKVNG